jgi:hypothetical protein
LRLFRTRAAALPDAPGAVAADDEYMRTTYGVVWREGASPLAAGKLEFLPLGIRLDGLEGTQDIPYELLAGVRVGRLACERIDGRPSVVIERRSGAPVTISTVAKPSLVGEIVEQLAALQLGDDPVRRLTVVLPIKPASRASVQALLENGPPFDPERLEGLDRHEVFLTPQEVIFLFDSNFGADALARLIAEPGLWQSAGAWGDHIAGPPRIADNVYSWARADGTDELSYLSTPGAGDSDGGDIF